MLPFDIKYLEEEYWNKKRSLSSLSKEWKVSTASLYNFFKKNKIKIRSRSEATSNSYEQGRQTTELDLETRKTISKKLVEYHKNKTPKQKETFSNRARFNLQSRGKSWVNNWKRKAGRDSNFSTRKCTKVVDYIAHYFRENGYSVVFDRRPADIVLNDEVAIIIDGYYRIKNSSKPGWEDRRKNELAEYGFKKIIYCKFNTTFSKFKADDLLKKILENGIMDESPEVIINE